MHILVQIVFYFILYFYIFLFWRDWTHVLAESQSSVKHVFMQIFPGHFTFILQMRRLSMNLNNVIYFIQDLENMGKNRIEFLIHKS